jgi:putative ABC transport system permease protein
MKRELLIAFRNILKNRTNSIITIVSMSVGIACSLLIYLFVAQEYSYNDFHENIEQICRSSYEVQLADGRKESYSLLDYKLPEKLINEVPQIRTSTSYRHAFTNKFKYENQYYNELLSLADSNFFKVFNFKLIAGNKEKLFINPDEIVITRELADKYLKTGKGTYHDLLGQTIEIGNKIPFIISGILENIPNNSTIGFDGIIPNYKYNFNFRQSNNAMGNSLVFSELNKDADIVAAKNNIANVINDHYSSKILELQQKNILSKSDDCFSPFLLSLNNVYLEDSIVAEYEKVSSKKYSRILIAIGLLILIIACINYITLTLGQSVKKVGEVSVRKTFGAKTKNIFKLFFAEGILLSLISVFFGILLCVLLIPVFGQLAHTEIFTDIINYPKAVLFGLSGFFGVVLLTSIVPGLIFAKIRPNLMSSKKFAIGKRSLFSQFFVAFQYSVSIMLIVITIFISRQLHYMKHEPLGITTNNVLDINIGFLKKNDRLAFNALLKKHAGIIGTTLSDRNFINGSSSRSIKKDSEETIEVRIIKVDHDYIATVGLDIIEGKDFTQENVKENDNAIIVNEKLVHQYEFKNDAIGKHLNIEGNDFYIIGVVKDFHFDSMKDKINPLVLFTRINMGNSYNNAMVKFHPKQLPNVMGHIKKSWKEIAPEHDLDYSFWDEELNSRYMAEERWGKIIGYSSIIAIIISSLGLFGLTILLINQQIKEIGIRKVNGAKISEILSMLNRNFIAWVAIAFVIACPVAYYAMTKWLENYVYKIELSWWVFALAGIMALGIALLTVSWQSWKAATRNPVEALRYE